MVNMTELQTGNERSTRKVLRRLAIVILLLGIVVVIVAVTQGVLSLTVNKRCIRWSGAHYEPSLLYPYPTTEKPVHERIDDLDGVVGFWDHLHADEKDREKQCTDMAGMATIAAFLYLGCGVVFIVTGSLGLGATKTMTHFRLSELKSAYYMMSILNSALFGPLLFYYGGTMALTSPLLVDKQSYWEDHCIIGAVCAFLGIVLTSLSITSASYVCCSRKTDEATMVTTTTTQQMPLQAVNTYTEVVPPGYTASASAPLNSTPAPLYPNSKVAELNQEANMVLPQQI